MELSKNELFVRLRTDPDFGIQFIVDNQGDEIIKLTTAKGVSISDKDALAVYLRNLLASNPLEFRNLLANIQYNPNTGNYTADLQNDFEAEKEALSKEREAVDSLGGSSKSFVDILPSILSGIGGVLTAMTSEPLSPAAMLEANTQIIAQQEAERKRKAKQQNLIIGGIVIFVIGLIIFIVVRNRKKTKKS